MTHTGRETRLSITSTGMWHLEMGLQLQKVVDVIPESTICKNLIFCVVVLVAEKTAFANQCDVRHPTAVRG